MLLLIASNYRSIIANSMRPFLSGNVYTIQGVFLVRIFMAGNIITEFPKNRQI